PPEPSDNHSLTLHDALPISKPATLFPPQRERPAPLFVKSATHRTAGTRQLRPTHSRKNVPVKPSAPGKKSMGIALSALRRVQSWIRFASVQLLCCPSRDRKSVV